MKWRNRLTELNNPEIVGLSGEQRRQLVQSISPDSPGGTSIVPNDFKSPDTYIAILEASAAYYIQDIADQETVNFIINSKSPELASARNTLNDEGRIHDINNPSELLNLVLAKLDQEAQMPGAATTAKKIRNIRHNFLNETSRGLVNTDFPELKRGVPKEGWKTIIVKAEPANNSWKATVTKSG